MTYEKFNSRNHQERGFQQRDFSQQKRDSGHPDKFRSSKSDQPYRKDYNNEEEKPLPEPHYYKAYAVCTSGDLPEDICGKLKRILRLLDSEGWTVRYSHGEKSDEIIDTASLSNKELHLPWKKFAEKEQGISYSSPEVFAIAKDNHSGWAKLSETVHKFLARTVRLITGEKSKSPAVFLLTYTEDGCENIREKTQKTGYMTFPIQVCFKANVPVFNLIRPDVEERLQVYLGIGSKPSTDNDESNTDFNDDSF